MGDCPLCGAEVGDGGGKSQLPNHIRRDCPAADPDDDAMTLGCSTDVEESSRQSASPQRGKDAIAEQGLPRTGSSPGVSTSGTLNRALSTETRDVEAAKE